jgi:adhesin transport system outer membrane protein
MAPRASLLLAALLTLAALPTLAAPLPAVVEQVLQRHPDIQSAQALLDASESLILETESDFYPSLGLNYRQANGVDEQSGVFINRDTRRTSANLRWNLFNGLTDRNRLRSAGFTRDAGARDLDDARERIALQVTQLYAEVVRLRQRLEIVDTLIRDYQSLSASVKQRVDAGRVAPADLDLVKSDLIRIRAQQSQMRGQMAGYEERLRQMTGQPATNLTTPWLDAPADVATLEQWQKRLEAGNPALRALARRADARAAEVSAARGSYWPSLDLQLDRRLAASISPAAISDTSRSSQISLNLDIPLGGKNLARVDESKARWRAALAAVESQRLSLSNDLGTVYQELAETRTIQPELLERVETTSRVYQAYRLQFDAGKRSLLEVASAENERYGAMGDVIDNRNQQFVDQAKLFSLTGQLRPALANHYHDSPLTAPPGERQASAEPLLCPAEYPATALPTRRLDRVRAPRQIRQ